MTDFDSAACVARAAKLVADAESSANRRDWQHADALFREAVSLDPSPASRISHGVCLWRQERFFDAISVFTPVLDSADSSAIGIVCHNLAAIYRDVGDLDLARRFQWRAMSLQEDEGPEDLLGLANQAMADERYQVAESLVTTAIEMNCAANRESVDGDLVATTGLIDAALTSKKNGLLTLFNAYRRHRKSDDLRGMGTDLVNMAVLFGELNRHRAENKCLERAIRCFECAPAPYSLHRATRQLALRTQMNLVRSFDARRN